MRAFFSALWPGVVTSKINLRLRSEFKSLDDEKATYPPEKPLVLLSYVKGHHSCWPICYKAIPNPNHRRFRTKQFNANSHRNAHNHRSLYRRTHPCRPRNLHTVCNSKYITTKAAPVGTAGFQYKACQTCPCASAIRARVPPQAGQ